jgi:hypothetical protein
MIIQSLTLVTTVALLFLVGKYAATHWFSGQSVRWVCFSTGLKKRDYMFERFAAAVIALCELQFTIGRQSGSAVLFHFQMP